MAVSLEKIEAWLPSEDELLLEPITTTTTTEFDPSCFPTEFPYEFHHSSPTESDSYPDEHQEEEDAFLAGLTRRLTHQLAFNPQGKKKRDDVAGSPESTLSGIGSCCWSVSVSSNGSPNGGLSPPTTPFSVQDDNDTLNRICAAAGHIARLKVGVNKGQLGPAAVGPRSLHSPSGLFSSRGFSSNASDVYQLYGHDNSQKQHMGQQLEQVIRKAQYSPLWQQPQHQQVRPNWHHQPHKQQQQQQYQQQQQHIPFKLAATSTVFQERSSGKASRPLGLPQSAWPPLQPRQRLSNQASYAGGCGPTHFTNVKKERTGTGVFLPQPKVYYGNNSSIKPQYSDSSKRKPGCSTVVLPTKVIQALNVNLENRNVNSLGHEHLRFHLGVSDYDLILARRNAILAQQKRDVLRSEGLLNHELRLPTDWKY